MRHPVLRILLILSGLLLVFGCVAIPDVRAPVTDASPVSEKEAVRINARMNAWRGQPTPLTAVLPVQVRIENDSRAPVEVAPEEFFLRFEDGQERTATAPAQLDAEELIAPGFVSQGTLLADQFDFGGSQTWPARRFPGLGTQPGEAPVVVSAGGVEEPARVRLPTSDMLERALPGGGIASGESVEGFLYFDHVPADAERAELHARIGGSWIVIPILLR